MGEFPPADWERERSPKQRRGPDSRPGPSPVSIPLPAGLYDYSPVRKLKLLKLDRLSGWFTLSIPRDSAVPPSK